MKCERLTAIDGDPIALAAQLRALVPPGASVSGRVAEIIGEVRTKGDAALSDYTRRFDTAGAEPSAIEVPAADLDAALERLDPDVRAGLERAIDNVGTVARAGLRHELTVVDFDGHQVLLREIAVRRAGIYVPGGLGAVPEHGSDGRGHRARRRGLRRGRVRSPPVPPATWTRRCLPDAGLRAPPGCTRSVALRPSPRSPTAPRPSRRST